MRRRQKLTPSIVGGRVSHRSEDAIETEFVHVLGSGTDPRNLWNVDPPERCLVPKGGAWVMITEALPPMERDIDQHVSVGRVFWAEHVSDECDDEGFLPNGRYKVVARTPFGEPHLMPHEYRRMDPSFLVYLWQNNGLSFTPMNHDKKTMNDIMFYAMSRGIARADAMVMALGSMTGPIGWFDPHPDLLPWVEQLNNVGRITKINHQRRAAARKARQS